MTPKLQLLTCKAARRLVAQTIERGWTVEISHGDGVITRRGRRLQDVPWCQLRASHERLPPIQVRVKELARERAEIGAAHELLAEIEGLHRVPTRKR